MILFHTVVTDLVAFNESDFGIFSDTERPTLVRIFREDCGGMSTKFLSRLSPDQKKKVVEWTCQRSKYSANELIEALSKFIKFLKTTSYTVYPPPSDDGKKKLKKIRFVEK